MDLERARQEWEDGLESCVATAVELTATLRTSDAAEWKAARERLQAEGVAIDQAVLFSLHSSGRHSTGAIVATPEGRVFDFDLVDTYGPDGQPIEKGVRWIESWDERTDKAEIVEKWNLPNLYLTAVIVARRLAEAGSE